MKRKRTGEHRFSAVVYETKFRGRISGSGTAPALFLFSRKIGWWMEQIANSGEDLFVLRWCWKYRRRIGP